MSIQEAQDIIRHYDEMNDIEFRDLIDHWEKYDIENELPERYQVLRNELVELFKVEYPKYPGRQKYLLDLQIGLKVYELLNDKNGFTYYEANDDDVWRYISVKVIPDLTYLRYPDPEKDGIRLNRKRFYSHPRRIWIKTLWWYIYLSWQGDTKTTYEALKDNGTNIISHLIERPGRGYRLMLFRSLMREYSNQEKKSDDLFRAAAKLNLAKCKMVEPALSNEGESGFVKRIFEELPQKEKTDVNE